MVNADRHGSDVCVDVAAGLLKGFECLYFAIIHQTTYFISPEVSLLYPVSTVVVNCFNYCSSSFEAPSG